MPALILPSRFNRQPQGAVEVDWNNDLVVAARFVYVSHPSSGRIIHDYKLGRVLTTVPAQTATPLGLRSSSASYTTQTIDIGPGVIGNSRSHFIIGTVNNTSTVELVLHATSSITPVSGGVKYTARTLDGYFNTATVSCDGVQPVWGVWDHANNLATCYAAGLSASVATTNSWAGYVANRCTINGHVNSGFLLGAVAEGVVGAELRNEINANPWHIFRKRPQILYFDVASGGAITGTGALTTGVTTASGSGTLTHTGTGSLTSGVTTLSGAGTLTHSGTGALTTLAATLAGAGVLTHVGTGSLTTGNVTLAGEGNVSQAGEVTGTGALTVSAITASGAGTITHTGTGSLQTSVVTLSGAGVLTHTGTGDLTTGVTTLDGTGSTLGTITGTGALTVGKVTVSGYDVLPVAVKPAGGGGTSTVSGRKRQKLIIVERVEDVEELLEQVEEIVQAEPKARKLKLSPKKPKQTVQNQPEAAFDWLSYYQTKLDTLRDQQRAESLKRQLDKNAEIIRAILVKQEEEARLALELQQEEEMMLLLMAA